MHVTLIKSPLPATASRFKTSFFSLSLFLFHFCISALAPALLRAAAGGRCFRRNRRARLPLRRRYRKKATTRTTAAMAMTTPTAMTAASALAGGSSSSSVGRTGLQSAMAADGGGVCALWRSGNHHL